MITITPPMLNAIQQRMIDLKVDVREIRIAPRNGSTVLVTLDAGYGTHSFVVNRNGRVWDAGLGEHVEMSHARRDELVTEALGVKPGETLRIELDDIPG